MLSYALAIVVASSSLVLFLTAFFMSDIHRQDDFLWSAVGLFYALILWFCARNFTGAMLLGQAAATGLLVTYSWQTLKLRKAIANPAKAAEISSFSVLQSINNLLKRNKSQVQPAVTSTESPTMPKVTEQEIAIPQASKTDTSESSTVKKNLPVKDEADSNSVEDDRLDTVADEQNTVSKTADRNISLPDEQLKAVESNSQPAATIDEKVSEVENKSSATQLQETSNKPKVESAESFAEPQTVVLDETVETSSSAKNAEIKPETKAKSTKDRDSQAEVRMPKVDVEPESTTVANDPNGTEINEPEPVKPKKPSSLDSLEMVEVAEVLEAVPEDVSGDRDLDRSNIIEVTTTEINVTSETKKIDIDEDDNPNSEQK